MADRSVSRPAGKAERHDVVCRICLRPAHNKALELCGAHLRRHRLGRDLSKPLREFFPSRMERLVATALRLAEAEGDRAYANARRDLRCAAVAFAKSSEARDA